MSRIARLMVAAVFGFLLIPGCSHDEDEVPGRVAIDVTLTIDGEPAKSGTLVLRPSTDVACPLVKLPVSNGKGSLPSASGPVPGQWTATFRSNAEGSLTDQLEDGGRANPLEGSIGSNRGSTAIKPPKSTPKSTSVSIPNDDPAVLQIKMIRS